MKQFKQAKKDGKTAFLSRAEPDKLFIDGVERCKNIRKII